MMRETQAVNQSGKGRWGRRPAPTASGVLALALSSVACLSLAQPGDSDGGRRLEEVLVTAQKRTQSMQDVPISITAFDRQAIEIQRINSLDDYALKTPNVGFVETGNRSRGQFAIRGITNLGGDVNAAGVYVDEFNIAPSASTRTFDVNLFDLESIEVLRGPQGTFFGRNTLAGAFNITTVKPSTDGFEGQMTVEYGNMGYIMGRGSFNIPLTDRFAARITGYYEEDDGWIDNIGPTGEGNSRDNYGGRLALRWEPTDNWVADFAASAVRY
ncbi:MAG: TonB-dependent receptor plug domain-containing protein, partial [Pseudomonadota bacterium]